jgi:phage tail-like protein
MLRIFDAVLRPIIETIDSMDGHFDPRLAPEGLLPFLAAWVGESPNRPIPVLRDLIRQAASLHRDRGTKDGLSTALSFATGAEALVVENTSGLRLDAHARLGINTTLAPFEPNSVHVTLLGARGPVDEEAVAGVVRDFKPAHATYSVRTSET